MSPADRSERRLLLLSALLGVWQVTTLPLFAQEAYYWCYAQHPALSYFDHPPMVAWMIWLGTQLFGDGALGIRLGTLCCMLAATWVGLLWLRRLGASDWVRRAWLVSAFAMPMLMAAHFLATPDPPLVCWWTVTMYALWRTRDAARPLGWWLLAGFAAGCALLSKYAAAFLAVGGLVLVLFDPAMRRQLRRPGIYLGVATAAVTFLPVIWWNVGNDFESFRFQTEGRWERARIGLHWLSDFVWSQVGLAHPVLAVLLPAGMWWSWRRARSGETMHVWLMAFGAPMPLFFLANSLLIHVKGNWLAPCYLPFAVMVATWWQAMGRRELRPRATRVLTRVLVGSALLFAFGAPLVRLVPQMAGSSWHGWQRIAERATLLAEELDQRDGVAGNVFCFASGYRDAAQLTLAMQQFADGRGDSGPVPPVLAQNVFGLPALQFDHWEQASRHVGEDAIFVIVRPDGRIKELPRLAAHFTSFEWKERVEVESLGVALAAADIWEARGYLGPEGR